MARLLSLHRVGLLAALLFVGNASTLHAQTITTFDVPDSFGQTIPSAINPAGQITGRYLSGHDAQGIDQYKAFLRYPDGTITTFSAGTGYRGREDTEPFAINPAGQITGHFLGEFPGDNAFLRDRDGTITTFAVEGFSDRPYAINPAGQIAGAADYASGDRGFLREPDGTITQFIVGYPTVPRGITPSGQITGSYGVCLCSAPDGGGFLREPDGTTSFFKVGSFFTSPQAITPAGQIVGYYADASAAYHGFLRGADGSITTFDVPNSTNVVPTGINQKRQITGFYLDASYTYHGFLRQPNGTVTAFDVPNSTYTYPTGINSKGQITGWYSDASGVHGFVRDK